MRHCLVILFLALLSGCTTPLRTNVAAEDAGYVVFSAGADLHSYASYYVLEFRDAAHRETLEHSYFHSTNPNAERAPDIRTPAFQGWVNTLRLKPGEYEIYNYKVRQPLAIGGDTFFTAGREFRIPFTVEKGKVTYLGQFNAQTLMGRNAYGNEVNAYFYYIITDESARDLAFAREARAIPAGAAVQGDVVVAPPLRHPLIRNERWPESDIPPGTFYPRAK